MYAILNLPVCDSILHNTFFHIKTYRWVHVITITHNSGWIYKK